MDKLIKLVAVAVVVVVVIVVCIIFKKPIWRTLVRMYKWVSGKAKAARNSDTIKKMEMKLAELKAKAMKKAD